MKNLLVVLLICMFSTPIVAGDISLLPPIVVPSGVKITWHPSPVDPATGAGVPDGYIVFGMNSQKTIAVITRDTTMVFPVDSLITTGITRVYWYVRAYNVVGRSAPSDTVNLPMTKVSFLFGDANMDNSVDVLDASLFWESGVMGSVKGSPNYDSQWDINCDGRIDVIDHVARIYNIGQRR